MAVVPNLLRMMFGGLFGNGRNLVAETAEVFFENEEQSAIREADVRHAALAQFGTEFMSPKHGKFDRFMDAVNRLPRPLLALGTLGLCVSAMVDPVWFASRMAGMALIPEPLWWLLGTIVSFYFGARFQVKSHAFQRDVATQLAHAHAVKAMIAPTQEAQTSNNAALAAWQEGAQ